MRLAPGSGDVVRGRLVVGTATAIDVVVAGRCLHELGTDVCQLLTHN